MISNKKPHIFKDRYGVWRVVPIRYRPLSEFDWIVLAIGYCLLPAEVFWKVDREFWNIQAKNFTERLNSK